MKTVYCFPKAQSILVLCFCVLALQTGAFAQKPTMLVGGGCEGCEGLFEGLPRILDWQTTIAPHHGNPLLTTSERAKRPKRGGSGIIMLTKCADGVWRGKRDIVLGRNVPNYPAGR